MNIKNHETFYLSECSELNNTYDNQGTEVRRGKLHDC